MDADALAVDLRGYVSPAVSPEGDSRGDSDELWLTETTIGGGGSVEEFLARYVEDPRRYFRFLDAALSPSDLETVGDDLARVLEMVSSAAPEHAALVAAFDAVRSANSHGESIRALATLRAEFARRGVQPTATLLVSVNTRLLRPGTNPGTDRYAAAMAKDWHAFENLLGIDIDARVFALVKSTDQSLERALGIAPVGDSDTSRAAWRFGVLYGMFLPRGAQIRTESLRGWNPYDQLPDCDRLLVLAALPQSDRQILLSRDGWFEELSAALLEEGSAELVVSINDSERLAHALLRIGAEPVDSEALLVHARLTGVRREADQLRAAIELPEALQ
jgi:hypothetical protein